MLKNKKLIMQNFSKKANKSYHNHRYGLRFSNLSQLQRVLEMQGGLKVMGIIYKIIITVVEQHLLNQKQTNKQFRSKIRLELHHNKSVILTIQVEYNLSILVCFFNNLRIVNIKREVLFLNKKRIIKRQLNLKTIVKIIKIVTYPQKNMEHKQFNKRIRQRRHQLRFVDRRIKHKKYYFISCLDNFYIFCC